MTTNRLEAFSDGVIAIIITIMVLEMKPPHEPNVAALTSLGSAFLSYILSFIYVGTYWNNHHHLLHAAQKIEGRILWANLHLLFWLSLIPFVTAWMGENHFAKLPVALYGFVLLMAGIAYYLLAHSLMSQRENAQLARAIGKDYKGIASIIIYAIAIPLSFLNPWLSFSLYALVAIMWIIPDRRIEKGIGE
ncbi:MAG: hypothetical protein A3I05_06110 [Deltaproteobacteria bacterium RIFCSPLOWO2_02_FULL_44_10]|nr:MAG: hypothetical protein A3C46_03995 [Deltaproteobacteria bacterium RIFCSPHIGHO2_02_FULL_44_16]OGQ45690.1 MAG: hypothetical protein A3I05_06110 [Deltaproteobacteria bacterium RIFCSPLOWO2_02_FULL_44_10]